MALLTSQGFIDDGSNDLVVQDQLSVSSFTGIASTLLGSGSSGSAGEAGHGSFAVGSFVSIPGPGFFLVPVTGSVSELGQRGASGFTGSLPNPASFPGAEIMITATTTNYDYVLTGSMSMSSGTTGAAWGTINGNRLTVPQGGTVGLKSDSKRWLIMYGSGSLQLRTL